MRPMTSIVSPRLATSERVSRRIAEAANVFDGFRFDDGIIITIEISFFSVCDLGCFYGDTQWPVF